MNRSVALLGLLAFSGACSDEVDESPTTTSVVGQVLDADGAPLVDARVSSVPPTEIVSTDDEGRFVLREARLTLSYVITAEKDGFIAASGVVTPTAQGPNEITLALRPQIICTPSERRCALGLDRTIEVCNASGTGYDVDVECAPEESCDPVDATCKSAFTLTVEAPSFGAVRSTPTGINCGVDCEQAFAAGTEVTLDAIALARGRFIGWAGACADAGLEPRCTVTMTADQTVQANFEASAYEVTVRRIGNGRGQVTSDPTGIDCPSTCAADFDRDAVVTFTAVADDGAEFERWERACSGTGPTCTLTIDSAKDVRARFREPAFTLRVAKEGTGDGRVTSEPGGIDCGGDCATELRQGSTVTLLAAPDETSTFESWSVCAGTDLSCTFTLDRDLTVRARFGAIPFYLLPLANDADCLVGLSFDGGTPLANRCQAGAEAILRGVARPDASRVAALDRAYFTDGSTAFTAMDSGRAGPVPPLATLELTVRRDGPAIDGGGRAILVSDVDAAAPAGGLRLVALDDGAVAIQTWQGGRVTATATAANALPLGQWAHIAATVNEQTLALFVDGQSRATAAAAGWTASSSTAWVAAQQDGATGTTHRLNGAFDEVRLSGSVRY